MSTVEPQGKVLENGITRVTTLLLACLVLLPQAGWADGIDIYMVLTGAPDILSPAKQTLWIAILLLLNYVLNFIVIGLAARYAGKIALPYLSKELIYYTALGQVADRLGAVLVFTMAFSVNNVSPGPPIFIIPLTLACVAAPIAVLTWYFAAHRWKLSRAMVYALTIAAMVLLHPIIISFVASPALYWLMFPK